MSRALSASPVCTLLQVSTGRAGWVAPGGVGGGGVSACLVKGALDLNPDCLGPDPASTTNELRTRQGVSHVTFLTCEVGTRRATVILWVEESTGGEDISHSV